MKAKINQPITSSNEKQITIIIPFFNEEKFLPRCINSLKKQPIDKTRIIFVDDGSTDRSKELCTTFCSEAANAECFCFKRNKGVSSARNYGIKKCKHSGY